MKSADLHRRIKFGSLCPCGVGSISQKVVVLWIQYRFRSAQKLSFQPSTHIKLGGSQFPKKKKIFAGLHRRDVCQAPPHRRCRGEVNFQTKFIPRNWIKYLVLYRKGMFAKLHLYWDWGQVPKMIFLLRIAWNVQLYKEKSCLLITTPVGWVQYQSISKKMS